LHALHEESKDKFGLFFDERSVYSRELKELDISLPPYDHIAQRTLDKAIDKLVNNGEVDSYRLAKKTFGVFANRLVSNAEITEKNVDFIGAELLEASKHYDVDVDLRSSLNNVGWFYFSKLENFDKALIYLEESARLGCANALSTITWYLMLQGKYQEAIDTFERHYYTIMATREYGIDFEQAANMRSNYAVSLWALGKDVSELNKIWQDEYFQGEHPESMFYPILIEYISGNSDKAVLDAKALPGYVLNQLQDEFSGDFSGNAWFKNIANKSLELLAKAN
jgi:tetratricopeptide (TPR) repeat protein